MTDYIGDLFGNYHLTRRIGQGGFADVYLGEHVRLGRKAAIKILHTHLMGDDIHLFQQEAQIIANLKHPHIIRLLDFDVHEGIPFLVLDYAPHGSLRQKYPPQARLPLPLIVDYARQVASALQYAHDQKLVHRDVKPENMLLDEQEQIVLSDFGIATIAHATSSMSTQASMGTLVYMAPEQIQGKARPASDQYALAVTVYSWLAGSFPFQGSSTEVIAQHLGSAVPSFHERGVQVAAQVEQVVLTALAKDPAARFGSMQAFGNALAHASGVASLSVQPFPASSPVRPEIAPTALATPQTHTVPANTPPAALPPTIPATPPAAQSTPAAVWPANAASLPRLHRLRKPWVIAAASEVAVPLVLFLIALAEGLLYPDPDLFFAFQIGQIYNFFFYCKAAVLGTPNCGIATQNTPGTSPGLPYCSFPLDPTVRPITFGDILPYLFSRYTLAFLLPLVCVIVAFVAGLLLARKTGKIRPGVMASIRACLCYLGATLVLLVLYFASAITFAGLKVYSPALRNLLPGGEEFLGGCAYLVTISLLSIGLSVACAMLGGVLGRKFAQSMPVAVAAGGASAAIMPGGMTQPAYTTPGGMTQPAYPRSTGPSPEIAQSISTGPSLEIANLAAQYQLGNLQVSIQSSEAGRMWLGGFAGLLAAVCLILVIVSQSGGVLALWLLFILVFGGLSAYALTFTARRGVHRVFLFANGLIDAEGTTTRVFPWDRIAEVWIRSTKRYETRSVIYIIQRDDGLKIQLTSMDFGTTNVDFLAATINEAVVRAQLPRAIQALQTGKDLTFGPITLNAREIETAHRRLPWSEVGNVTVENGFLYVTKPGQLKMLGLSVAVMQIPNLALLLKLIDSVKQTIT